MKNQNKNKRTIDFIVSFTSDGGGFHDRHVTFFGYPTLNDMKELRKRLEKDVGKKIVFLNLIKFEAKA